MDTIQFLRKILPAEGIYCASRLVKGKFRNQPCDSIEELAQQVLLYDSQGVAAYHACASYRERSTKEIFDGKETDYFRRKQSNVRAVRSFWCDLDVAPGNPQKYEFQAEAIDGLVAFCEQSGLPIPLVVSSGGGVHIYWTLTEAISHDAWKQTAEGLKALAGRIGLLADPACTADAARVLRPVGTWNRKSASPVPVELIADAAPVQYAVFRQRVLDALSRLGIKQPEAVRQRDTPTEKVNAQFAVHQDWPPTSIKKVADRCAQLAKMRDTKGCVSEPHWYAGIQLMVHGVEGDELIHEWSNGHDKYSAEETNRKIAQVRTQSLGPTLCATFDARSPGGCDTCPFKGKISSPAQLGAEPKNEAPPPVALPALGTITAVQVDIPPAPPPFARSEGGIWMTEDGVQHKVYPYDIYPTGIVYDEHVGHEMVHLRHWLPQEGWRDCSIQSALLAKPTDFEVALRNNSIQSLSSKRMVMYMDSYLRKLRETTAMRRLFKSMGWKPDGEFVLGDRLYRADGSIVQAGFSTRGAGFLGDFQTKGDLANWRALTSIFQHTKGLEAHAFMLLMAFVPPLLELGGRDGFTVNALSTESGIGKSTMGKFVASVYGHPEATWIGKLDTANARIERLGAYSAVPAYMDEITTIEPKELRELVYMMPTGKGRAALSKDRQLRESAHWKTVLLCSSNDSLQSKLQAVKQNAEAEGMRLFEFRFPTVPRFAELAKEYIHPLLAENYGLAGGHYIKQLVANRARIAAEINPAILALEKEFRMQDKERFWSQAVALALYGGRLAREWGLIEFDPEIVRPWLQAETQHMRGEIQSAMVNPIAVLAEYLDQHVGERLVVTGVNANMGATHKAPMHSITQRLELDSMTLWFTRSHFNQWCQKHNHSYNDVRAVAFGKGVLQSGDTKITLGKGTDYGGGAVPCWRIKADHPELTQHTTVAANG